MKKVWARFGLFLACVGLLPGCGQKIVDSVAFKVLPNLETVELSMAFAPQWQIGFGGTYALPFADKPYGVLSVQPTTATTPFTVKFRLDTRIVNDPEFNDVINFQPVTTLPTGFPLPFGIDRALVKIKGTQPVDANVDVYTYVDVAKGEWMGVALVFPKVDLAFIPPNLTLFQQFLSGFASVTAFGPAVASDGARLAPPGIGIFANIPELLKIAEKTGTRSGMTGPQSSRVIRVRF
jgi:hypothetical protein